MYWIAPDDLNQSSVALCARSRTLIRQARHRIIRRRPVCGGSDGNPWKLDNQSNEHGEPICPVCDRPIVPAANVAQLDGFMAHIECWPSKSG